MPSAVPYIPRAFIPDRYEPRQRLGDYAIAHGRDIAAGLRYGGDLSAQLWGGIGQNISGSLRDIAAYPEQQRQAQMLATKQQREEQAYQESEQQKQAHMAKVKRLEQLVGEYGGRVPSDRLVKEFGLSDAAQINKEFDSIYPTPKAPEPYTLNPGDVRFGGDNQQVASVPKPEPVKEPKEPKTHTITVPGPDGRPMAKVVTEEELRGGVPVYREPRAPVVDNSPLETIIGPDGKPVRVRRQDAIGKPPAAGTEKPSSGQQKRTLNFFNRAEQADKDLEGLEAEIQRMGLGSQARMALAPNIMQSQTGQAYTQAQRAFTEARLRKDSGAAIPTAEYDNDRKTYFAQPGDSPETLEQKRRGRAAVLASLAFESGQALGEFLGDAEEAAAVVERYKARSQPAVSAVPDLAGLRDGSKAVFRDGPFKGQEWAMVNGQPKRLK